MQMHDFECVVQFDVMQIQCMINFMLWFTLIFNICVLIYEIFANENEKFPVWIKLFYYCLSWNGQIKSNIKF